MPYLALLHDAIRAFSALCRAGTLILGILLGLLIGAYSLNAQAADCPDGNVGNGCRTAAARALERELLGSISVETQDQDIRAQNMALSSQRLLHKVIDGECRVDAFVTYGPKGSVEGWAKCRLIALEAIRDHGPFVLDLIRTARGSTGSRSSVPGTSSDSFVSPTNSLGIGTPPLLGDPGLAQPPAELQ